MSFTRYFASLTLLLAVVSATETLNKRSPLLESRQRCRNPSFIPACPVGIPCVPPGAICCSDGIHYAMPPQTCPEGTTPLTTAGVPGPEPTTTIESTSTIKSTITAAPTSTSAIINYRYFTYEITWYYYYYYYTYLAAYQSTSLASTQVTTVTTVSVQATDAAQASELFSQLSATLPLPTPTQAATSLSGTIPPPTATPTPSVTASSNFTIPTTTGPIQFTGGAASVRRSFASGLKGLEWIVALLMVGPGVAMLML